MRLLARAWVHYDRARSERKRKLAPDNRLRRAKRAVRRACVRMKDDRVVEILRASNAAPQNIDLLAARYAWSDGNRRGECSARAAARHVIAGHVVVWAPFADDMHRRAAMEKFCRIDEARRAFRRQHPYARSMYDSRMPGNPTKPSRVSDDAIRDRAARWEAVRQAFCR